MPNAALKLFVLLEVFSPTQYYMQILSFLPGLDIV